ncbi:hypothetical protein [Sulfurimonas diazotrophicus]|uniref:Uncharacterized protein n=1 Tax=Sulfurimonas diazotrophicus TaxID=3131939 RepID=A0ABZ3HCV0_9BACT
MDSVRTLIAENSEKYGEFSYYELLIEKVETNLTPHPDIAIEACKALIEGISKTILLRLDNSLTEKDMREWPFQKLFSTTVNKLGELSDEFEAEFIYHFRHPIHLLGEIRTHRGDIAHGKPVPKVLCSSKGFAKFIEEFTGVVIVYMLKHFFALEITRIEQISYEENPNFNGSLDDSFPLGGYVKYSKALYEQDYTSYEEQLQDYLLDQEKIEPEIVSEEEIEPLEEMTEQVYKKEDAEPIKEERDISDTIEERYKDLLSLEGSEEAITTLCQDENLYINELLKIVETYQFDHRVPLPDAIVDTMKHRPKLLQRREAVERVTKALLAFVKQYIAKDEE